MARGRSDGSMWAVVLGATALVIALAIARGRGGVGGLEGKPAPKFPLGRETTYVTGPLDKEG